MNLSIKNMEDDILKRIEERHKKWQGRRMGVTYKDFDDMPDLTLKAYKEFYFKEFPKLLRWFYPSMSDDGRMILFATRESNEDRRFRILAEGPGELDSTGEYFFSVSVFFTCLIPQVLAKCIGHKAMDMFFRASGWPLMSSGMGGQVSAECWLKDSGIYPDEAEVRWYNALIDIVKPFFAGEIREFLEGGQASLDDAAYSQLVESAKGKTDAVEETLMTAVTQAEDNFRTGEAPVYWFKPWNAQD